MVKYTVMELLGKGTFGEVYKARNNQNGELVAIKKVRATEELKKEANFLNQFRHQNIVAFVEAFEENGDLCIVQELCEGKFSWLSNG